MVFDAYLTSLLVKRTRKLCFGWFFDFFGKLTIRKGCFFRKTAPSSWTLPSPRFGCIFFGVCGIDLLFFLVFLR